MTSSPNSERQMAAPALAAMRRRRLRSWGGLAAGLFLLGGNLMGSAFAQGANPAATALRFNSVLIASMHHDTARLPQAVADEFNASVMAAFIVGPAWSTMSSADQGSVAAALRRYLAARFADAFDADDGERLVVDPNVQSRGADVLVRTDIAHSDGAHTHLDYRMRAYDGQWRIIDVFLDGVSQLTTQRADLAAIAPGGAPALVARLDAATRALH